MTHFRATTAGCVLFLVTLVACAPSGPPAQPSTTPSSAPVPTTTAVSEVVPTATSVAEVVQTMPPAATALPTTPPPTPGAVPAPTAEPSGPRPPLTPRWVYEPWVWEDEKHTSEAVLDLLDGYRREGIPVGAVLLDSPWQTNYNTFEFGPGYRDPEALIRRLHERNVRVVLWATQYVNVSSIDGPERGKAPHYDEAHAAGYFIEGGRVYEWWKGQGSAIDFFNPRAVTWWYQRMDRAFRVGVDGFKADNGEHRLPDTVQTAAGPKSELEYGAAYYRAYYRYVAERNPEAIILARPYEDGRLYAPVEANPAGWVGDQGPDWQGLREALENILVSAERGYAVVGSDIGGYGDGKRDEDVFIRWTQVGALSPLMENGGLGEHRPWEISRDALRAYRYYAKLHHQLVPYLYSAGVEAHRTGRPIIRDPDRSARQYRLGEDLLVAPITSDDKRRDVRLPGGSRWYDYWDDDRIHDGSNTVRHNAPTERVPLFVRAGAIIPMQVDDNETGHGGGGSAGRLTLLVYPESESVRTYSLDAERSLELRSRRQPSGVTVDISPHTERYVLRIKEPSRPSVARLSRGSAEADLTTLSSWEEFERADEGWYYDSKLHYVWARFATRETAARLTYPTAR
jgi:alpha-glucosidase (family GH31 glycosyl hydrolase)